MRTARLLASLTPLTALVLLGGCSAGLEDPEPAPETTHAQDVRTKATPAGGKEARPDDDAAAAEDLAACILGEWEITPEAVRAMTDAAVALSGMDVTVTTSGTATVAIDAGSMTTTYVDYVTDATFTDHGETLRSVNTINGTAVQHYWLDGDLLSTDGVDMSGMTSTMTTYLNGVEATVPSFDAGYQDGMKATMTEGGTVRLTCTDTELVQIPVLGATELPELATTLSRR